MTITMVSASLMACGNDKEPAPQDLSSKAERNFIREGNKLFAHDNFADAEIEYSKALQANPASATAAYNMALALVKQATPGGDSTGILQRADSLFSYAASITNDNNLKMMAHYNKGNIAYGYQQYDKAIEDYKNALRAVPTDEDSRYNLRMAQLKQQQQQQQQQQDKNQDKNQQKQDQQNQDQQNQDQQNQDQQNQDKQNQDKQNQDQQGQGQNQQGNQDKAKQDQGQQQSGNQQQQQGNPINMDERSIQQVLKAMEDKEKQTQQKIYQMGQRQREQERRATQNKW